MSRSRAPHDHRLSGAMTASLLAGLAAAGTSSAHAQGQAAITSFSGLHGVRVGHHTLSKRPTGCTVILVESGAVGGVDVRGGAPGTRETDALDPVNSVSVVHAVVLSGGSAFGLDASTGVMRYLEERGVGFETGVARVPIVTQAILFDLGVGGDPSIRPDAQCGYEAARDAAEGAIEEGSVGAGAGATVGKLRGTERAMKGGIGAASVTLPSGLTVAAIVAVNALGDVIDPATGQVVAGVRTADGTGLADPRGLLLGAESQPDQDARNTTIGVVITNARLTKSQATKVAQMSQDGLARAVLPSHTPWDGDTMFSLATGSFAGEADVLIVGALAAEVTSEAILRAVRLAHGLEGLPSVSDLAARGQ